MKKKMGICYLGCLWETVGPSLIQIVANLPNAQTTKHMTEYRSPEIPKYPDTPREIQFQERSSGKCPYLSVCQSVGNCMRIWS